MTTQQGNCVAVPKPDRPGTALAEFRCWDCEPQEGERVAGIMVGKRAWCPVCRRTFEAKTQVVVLPDREEE